MKAILISIGDEILSGKIVNSDFAILAAELTRRGVEVVKEITVPDRKDAIEEELKKALIAADLVITTGGLGPTPDDVTRQAVAEALGRKLVFSEQVYRGILEKLKKMGLPEKKAHRNYAYIIEGFEPIENDVGLAPGLFGEIESKKIVVLPGPPRELRSVLDKVIDKIAPMPDVITLTRRVKTFGLRETQIYELLEPHRKELEPLGYYPSIYGVEIELRATGKPEEAKKVLDEKARRIQEILGENVYGFDDEKLEAVLGRLLRERGMTIATAESCTGGLVGNLITDIPGSSDYYLGSVVAYHNDVKEKLLGVPKVILTHFGAVSEPTAVLMAEGVRKLLNADVGISTTGIAGPTGGTPQKPVGLVYMAVALPTGTKAIKKMFSGNRLEIKRQSAYTVIDLARRELLKLEK